MAILCFIYLIEDVSRIKESRKATGSTLKIKIKLSVVNTPAGHACSLTLAVLYLTIRL